MANKEVCEVFIEQQIEERLQEGKTAYSIGKELSLWVEKLFQAKIPATTVEKRAERIRGKDFPTNVGNDLTPEPATEKEPIQDFKSHGGAREGAGRPRTELVSEAAMIVDICIRTLERILPKDPKRTVELVRLQNHVQKLMKEM